MKSNWLASLWSWFCKHCQVRKAHTVVVGGRHDALIGCGAHAPCWVVWVVARTVDSAVFEVQITARWHLRTPVSKHRVGHRQIPEAKSSLTSCQLETEKKNWGFRYGTATRDHTGCLIHKTMKSIGGCRFLRMQTAAITADWRKIFGLKSKLLNNSNFCDFGRDALGSSLSHARANRSWQPYFKRLPRVT